MTIPDAAIEAAAEALWRSAQDDRRMHVDINPKPSWASRGELTKGIWRRDARAALEAAMPAIREAIAQEIDALPHHFGGNLRYDEGLRAANRIVRGGAA